MSKVKIMPIEKAEGAKVSAYAKSEGKAQWGFMHLRSEETSFRNGILNTESRNCLVRGPLEGLQAVVKANPTGTMPGKIQVIECLESAIPANCKAQINQKLVDAGDIEGALKGFIKTAGEDGDVLMKNGERILRFQIYDETGSLNDVRIQHDDPTVEVVAETIPEMEENKA